MQTIKGKNILITGATGGIGANVAKLLSAGGANVFITGRNEEKLHQVATDNKIAADKYFVADVSKSEEVESLRKAYFTAFEQIDILINAAGIGIIKPLDQLTEADFLQSLNILHGLLFGIFRLLIQKCQDFQVHLFRRFY